MNSNEQLPSEQPTEQATESTQPAPREEFSAHQAVEDLFSNINRSPLRDLPQSPQNESQLPNATGSQAEASPAPPATPPEPKHDWEKRYNDLQSDYDRRVNTAVDKVRQEVNGQIQALTAALMQRSQQQPSTQLPADEGYDRPLTRAEAMQLAQQTAEQIYAARVASDPRIAAGGMIGDWARYRGEFKDSPKYDPLIETFLEEFPELGTRDLYGNLAKFYRIGDKLVQKYQAAQQANVQGEATRNNPSPPASTQVNPAGNGRLTAEQAASLANRSRAYRMEQGVSAATSTRPEIDSTGNLEEELDKIVSRVVRGQRR